ncbi:MAG: hypothetical protein OXH97_07110 [Chloroflexota bacterium]|nr:hypothetical protein [Chloroflexota bacterium]
MTTPDPQPDPHAAHEEPPAPAVEPPPVVRLDAPADSAASLLTATLVEALRERGYRTASAERRPGGRLAVTLTSGGRVGIEREVAESDLGAFVAGLDPAADLVLAFGYEDPSAPPPTAIVLSAGGEELATIDPDELTPSLQSGGPSPAVEGLASLLDARVLGGGPADAEAVEESSGRGLGSRVRGWLRR